MLQVGIDVGLEGSRLALEDERHHVVFVKPQYRAEGCLPPIALVHANLVEPSFKVQSGKVFSAPQHFRNRLNGRKREVGGNR